MRFKEESEATVAIYGIGNKRVESLLRGRTELRRVKAAEKAG